MDSAAGRLGNPIDQLLLYCYQYDPSKGRYSASILNIVRLGGLLTVVGMIALIVTLSLKTRRQSGSPQGQDTPLER